MIVHTKWKRRTIPSRWSRCAQRRNAVRFASRRPPCGSRPVTTTTREDARKPDTDGVQSFADGYRWAGLTLDKTAHPKDFDRGPITYGPPQRCRAIRVHPDNPDRPSSQSMPLAFGRDTVLLNGGNGGWDPRANHWQAAATARTGIAGYSPTKERGMKSLRSGPPLCRWTGTFATYPDAMPPVWKTTAGRRGTCQRPSSKVKAVGDWKTVRWLSHHGDPRFAARRLDKSGSTFIEFLWRDDWATLSVEGR